MLWGEYMQPMPEIPDGELDSDLDFIKQVTIFATIVILLAAGIFAYMIFTGEISLSGPSALVLEKEKDFDELVNYDSVDNLTGSGVDVCMVDSGIDMEHSDLSNLNLAEWSDFIGSRSKPYDDHGHGKKEKHDDHGHGHGHGEYDPHIWLDPHNAEVMIEEIAKQLAAIDPQNAATYKKNSNNAIEDIEKLIKDIKKEMKKDISYIVFHDAYQYFEKEFNVSAFGALTLNTDVAPGAKQISKIREIIEHDNVKCLFSEPQFNPDIIKSIAKGTNVKVGVLDPLGANLKNGKELYFKLIRDISSSLKKC